MNSMTVTSPDHLERSRLATSRTTSVRSRRACHECRSRYGNTGAGAAGPISMTLSYTTCCRTRPGFSPREERLSQRPHLLTPLIPPRTITEKTLVGQQAGIVIRFHLGFPPGSSAINSPRSAAAIPFSTAARKWASSSRLTGNNIRRQPLGHGPGFRGDLRKCACCSGVKCTFHCVQSTGKSSVWATALGG